MKDKTKRGIEKEGKNKRNIEISVWIKIRKFNIQFLILKDEHVPPKHIYFILFYRSKLGNITQDSDFYLTYARFDTPLTLSSDV
jgi:hypothetical protein